MDALILFAPIAVVVLIAVLVAISCWKVPKADQALVITGWRATKVGADGSKTYKIITAGGAFVIPRLQKAQFLSLAASKAVLHVDGVDSQRIPIGVRGSVVFKVGPDAASITNAAQRFMDDQGVERGEATNKMMDLVQEVVHGHLRSIVGAMTVEDLINNRSRLAEEARDASVQDLSNLGLIMDSLQIQQIDDPSGYIKALGEPRAAEVQKAARIAAASADREATQREQEANALKAQAERDTAIKMAEYQAERDKATAISEQAGPRADAEARKAVVEQETEVARLEAEREQRRLEATVHKQADAQAYAERTQAAAARDAQVARAEAEAKQRELTGAAEATVIKQTGDAEAEALKQKGLAEAVGIEARGKALQIESEAVIATQVAEKLPEIVGAAAKAFASVDNLTVLNGAEGMSQILHNLVAQGGPLLQAARQTLSQAREATEGADEVLTPGNDDITEVR